MTKDEMRVVFWLSADARDGSNPQPKAADIDSSADILEFRRRSRLAADGSNQNLSISGSLIGKIGRGCPKVIEPQGLTVNRVYAILWKKQSLDTAELARMRVEEGLGSRVISQRLGVPRSTVIGAIHRLERKG